MKFIKPNKRPATKKLSLRRRHHGMTARMRIEANQIAKVIHKLAKVYKALRTQLVPRKIKKLKKILLVLIVEYHKITAAPDGIDDKPRKLDRLYRTIDSFEDDQIPQYFRFRNKEQLHDLLNGFQIPNWVVLATGSYVQFF